MIHREDECDTPLLNMLFVIRLVKLSIINVAGVCSVTVQFNGFMQSSHDVFSSKSCLPALFSFSSAYVPYGCVNVEWYSRRLVYLQGARHMLIR